MCIGVLKQNMSYGGKRRLVRGLLWHVGHWEAENGRQVIIANREHRAYPRECTQAFEDVVTDLRSRFPLLEKRIFQDADIPYAIPDPIF